LAAFDGFGFIASSGKAAFSYTVMCGQIAYDWNTMPMSRECGGTKWPFPETTRSPMRIVPASGRSRPAMQRRVVVFPQPDGPSSV